MISPIIRFELFNKGDDKRVGQIKELLYQSFEWTCSDIESNLDTIDDGNGYLLIIDDVVISCIFVIDVFDSQQNKFAYLFSVATDSNYRKQGLLTNLYESFARPNLIAHGYVASVLTVTEDKLISFYESLNFRVTKVLQQQEPHVQMIDSFVSELKTDLDVLTIVE